MSSEPTGFRSEQYEFNDEQNRTIGGLADAMGTVAFPMKILGLLFLVVFGLTLAARVPTRGDYGILIGLGVPALLFLTFGFWLSSAAKSFRRITESRNEDIWHLMNALSKLRNLFGLLRIIIMGSLVLLLISIILSMM